MEILGWLFGSVTGIIVLIIGCATAVVIVAMCHKYSVAGPQSTVIGIAPNGAKIVAASKHPFFGPGEYAPQVTEMTKANEALVDRFTGYSRENPPVISMEEVRRLERGE